MRKARSLPLRSVLFGGDNRSTDIANAKFMVTQTWVYSNVNSLLVYPQI